MDAKLFQFLFGCKPEDITANVILTPFISLNKFAAGQKQERSFSGRFYSGAVFSSESGDFTVINSGIGASSAGDCVVFLGGTQAEKVIYAGSCGGLKGAEIGDVIFAEKAFDGTGYSGYSGPDTDIKAIIEKAASFGASPEMAGYFSAADGVKSGNVFTIGSLAAESRKNMEELVAKGFIGVDMETAVVYTAAKTADIKAAALLFVSDLPPEKPFWEKLEGPDREKYKEGMGRLVRIAVECGLNK